MGNKNPGAAGEIHNKQRRLGIYQREEDDGPREANAGGTGRIERATGQHWERGRGAQATNDSGIDNFY